MHGPLLQRLAPLPVSLSRHTSDPPNPWAGYQQAMMQAAVSHYSHVIVLQDDVIPCDGFPRAVMEGIRERPEDVLSLWVGDLRDTTARFYRKAQTKGERWSPVHFSDIHHCVALVWPREIALEFLHWAATSRLPGEDRPRQSDDAIVGAWARRTRHQVWAVVPSLVEHNDDVPSTIGRPQGGRDRRAISFIG